MVIWEEDRNAAEKQLAIREKRRNVAHIPTKAIAMIAKEPYRSGVRAGAFSGTESP